MAEARRKHPMKSFEWVYGMGCNWVDVTTGIMYYIQEYKEAKDRGETPNGIRTSTGEYVSEYKMKELMEDPEPDPRYAPETPAEHRRNRK